MRRPQVPVPGWWTCHIPGCSYGGQQVRCTDEESPADVWARHYRESGDPDHYIARTASMPAVSALPGKPANLNRVGMDRAAFERARIGPS